jgi:hypothetical protein
MACRRSAVRSRYAPPIPPTYRLSYAIAIARSCSALEEGYLPKLLFNFGHISLSPSHLYDDEDHSRVNAAFDAGKLIPCSPIELGIAALTSGNSADTADSCVIYSSKYALCVV